VRLRQIAHFPAWRQWPLFFQIYQVFSQEFFNGFYGFILDGSGALGNPYRKITKLLRIDLNHFPHQN
jgi:hypothetical protein